MQSYLGQQEVQGHLLGMLFIVTLQQYSSLTSLTVKEHYLCCLVNCTNLNIS